MSFYAFAFWLSAKLIEDGEITFKKMNVAYGHLPLLLLDWELLPRSLVIRVRQTWQESYFRIDRSCTENSVRPFDKMVVPTEFSAEHGLKGDIEFQNVKFAYPTRLCDGVRI